MDLTHLKIALTNVERNSSIRKSEKQKELLKKCTKSSRWCKHELVREHVRIKNNQENEENNEENIVAENDSIVKKNEN